MTGTTTGMSSRVLPFPSPACTHVVVVDDDLVVSGLRDLMSDRSDVVVTADRDAAGPPVGDRTIVVHDPSTSSPQRMRELRRVADAVIELRTDDPPWPHSRSEPADLTICKRSSATEIIAAISSLMHPAAPADGEDTPTDLLAGLSEREREVAALIAQGCSNRDIAERLYLSVDTVKTYLRRTFAKLGVSNRTQVALVVVAAGHRREPSGQPGADEPVAAARRAI